MAESLVVAKDEMKRYLPYLGMFRYIRNSFWAAGQDSYSRPPAQNEDLFELLTNIQPITTGTFLRRWGYDLFVPEGTIPFEVVRLLMYQRDSDGERVIVAAEEAQDIGPPFGLVTQFVPILEDGSPLAPAAFGGFYYAPGSPTPATNVRGVSSRDWLYTNVWDGTYHYKWMGNAPPPAPSATNFSGGSINGTHTYQAAYIDASGVVHAVGPPFALAGSSSSRVLVLSPPAQPGMVSWNVYSDFGILQGTALIGTDILLTSLAGSGAAPIPNEEFVPMGAIAPAAAPIFSVGAPSGTGRSVTDGSMTATVGLLFSSTASFASTDMGATVTVAGAGPGGGLLSGHIIIVVSPTEVKLDVVASTDVSSAAVTITDLPQRSVSDAAIAAGSSTMTSATAAFVSTDVGSTVQIVGAGVAGGLYTSTIVSVISSTSAVLETLAATTVTGAVAHIIASGLISLSVGRIYFAVFQSTLTGHVSDLSPASVSTGPVANVQIQVNVSTANIGPATPGMDVVVLLATVDGGDQQTLYKVAQGPVASTTILTDALTEATLLEQPVYVNVDQYGNFFGAVGNTPPPVQMTNFLKHQGRLFGYHGQNIYFSKSIAECLLATGNIVGHYEECWPANYFFDISQAAETVHAHFSDGTVYYIASERTIYRLIGNTPLQGTTGTIFQEPEVVFNDVGVVNPDVWQAVYNAGQPIGTCWLAPDLRVIMSDFNTYRDIGHSVQDLLNTINLTQIQNAFAVFISSGPLDLYALAVPTGTNTNCDTLLVYNMRTGLWVVWQPANQLTAGLFNITEAGVVQFLTSVIGNVGFNLVEWGAQFPRDTAFTPIFPVPFPAPVVLQIPLIVQTSWLSLQDPSIRKVLNQIELIAGDPTTVQVTIYGANSQADFQSPFVITNLALLSESVLGSWFVYLAGYASVYRYFKIRVEGYRTSTDPSFLEGFNLEAVPFNRE